MKEKYMIYLDQLEERRKEDHKMIIDALNNQKSTVLIRKNRRSIHDAVLSTQEADRRKT